MDYRVENLAKILTDYSVDVKEGNLVYIRSTPLAEPLLKEVYKNLLQKGAHPLPRIKMDSLEEIFFKFASEYQIDYIPETMKYIVENTDIMISLRGKKNTRALSNISPDLLARRRKATRPIMKTHMKRSAEGDLQWTTTQFPTQAEAQEADHSLSEYEDFVYGACFADRDNPVEEWENLSEEQEEYIEMLEEKDSFHIEGPGTDLEIRAGGRTWINSDGKRNMPSGEVFTAPVEDSANGIIKFSFPAIYNSREVTGVTLEFEEGEVVNAEAEKGEDFLNEMINMDEGSRFLGEFAFGLNYGIQKFTKNILFDEKIGGTMHLALGNAYPECGGSNSSGLHWDMIMDLRDRGRVTADGDTIFEEGEFIL